MKVRATAGALERAERPREMAASTAVEKPNTTAGRVNTAAMLPRVRGLFLEGRAAGSVCWRQRRSFAGIPCYARMCPVAARNFEVVNCLVTNQKHRRSPDKEFKRRVELNSPKLAAESAALRTHDAEIGPFRRSPGHASPQRQGRANPQLLLSLVAAGARATGRSAQWCARHPKEVLFCGGTAVALLRLRREAKDYGFRLGGGSTLMLPTSQFRSAALREAEELAEDVDLDALVDSMNVVYGKTVELGSGDVAFVKAKQILEQWRFLERDEDVLVTIGDGRADESKCLTITVKGMLGWQTGGYAVAYHTQAEAEESEEESFAESVELGLTTLSHCGWKGILELKAERDTEGLVSFTASVLKDKGKAPRLVGTRCSEGAFAAQGGAASSHLDLCVRPRTWFNGLSRRSSSSTIA
eukprot:scaffold1247_cov251-Pinguiococcus_pyrenoidosus.AAC.10